MTSLYVIRFKNWNLNCRRNSLHSTWYGENPTCCDNYNIVQYNRINFPYMRTWLRLTIHWSKLEYACSQNLCNWSTRLIMIKIVIDSSSLIFILSFFICVPYSICDNTRFNEETTKLTVTTAIFCMDQRRWSSLIKKVIGSSLFVLYIVFTLIRW